MAFQAVPDTAEIDHIFTNNGVTVQNTHYGRLPGGYSLANLQALADAIDAVFASTFFSEMCPEGVYIRTDVRGLAFENDFLATQNAGAGPGTHGGSSLPNNCTFAIKKLSGQTGRSARGRSFWVSLPETELAAANENTVVAGFITSMVADINQIRIVIGNTGLWEPVLVSRFQNKVKRAVGVTFPWVSTTNTDNIVDTHRGQLPKA